MDAEVALATVKRLTGFSRILSKQLLAIIENLRYNTERKISTCHVSP
jgi:hypothetical protein